MQSRNRRRLSVRHAVVLGLATVSALVPVAARADTGLDVNGVVDVVVSTVPDGSFIDGALGAATSKVATCVIQTYITRAEVAAEGGDEVSCGNVVVSLSTQASLCDDLLGPCAVSGVCTGTNECHNDVTLVPAPDTDGLTLTVTVTAKARAGWTWGSLPSGCRASGSSMSCTVTQHSSGLLGPIVPVL